MRLPTSLLRPVWTFLFILLALLLDITSSTELTFELPDNAKQCFHNVIEKGIKSTIEFQVITGGHYDVDMNVESPTGQVLYSDVKKQYDTFTWTAEQMGVFTVCFSNEFSTFSHKLVYIDWQVGEEKALPGIGEHLTAMTQMESSANNVHEGLNSVIDYQTHHRLREAQGRKRAEDLNERVLWWSIGETVAVLVIGIGQVFILKNFFVEKRPVQYK